MLLAVRLRERTRPHDVIRLLAAVRPADLDAATDATPPPSHPSV